MILNNPDRYYRAIRNVESVLLRNIIEKEDEAIMNNYPPNVTGNEPQICGAGLEDYCVTCTDELAPRSAPEAVIGIHGEPSCEDCLKQHIEENGINFDDLREYFEWEFLNKIRKAVK